MRAAVYDIVLVRDMVIYILIYRSVMGCYMQASVNEIVLVRDMVIYIYIIIYIYTNRVTTKLIYKTKQFSLNMTTKYFTKRNHFH